MDMPKMMRSCLVVSYGPVPTSQYQTIEGGGMRAWGLAKGIAAQGIDVTVAVNGSFPQKLKEFDGIHLTNWAADQSFADLINSFDAVIASFSMGSDSVFIADNINDGVQLILDVYVPIYVEVSARDSKDIDAEYVNYAADIQRFNHVLKRGDYFLCASSVQKIFYTGVLGSLGIVNPRSYRQNRILIVPFGIHDIPLNIKNNPYTKQLGLKKTNFVMLWFGGLYPWFRVEELLDSILELSKDPNFKFVVVGGKNPFNPNPDFAKQYETTLVFVKKHNLLNKSVFLVDWVDFDTRSEWFKYADVLISINNPGEENNFSWRTRVMDFIWGETPILTNGEDVLSEELLARSAALRLETLSSESIVKNVQYLMKNPSALENVKKNLLLIKKEYYWHNIVSPAVTVIEAGQIPAVEERLYAKKLGVTDVDQITIPQSLPLRALRASAAGKALRYYRRHGATNALRRGAKSVKRRLPATETPTIKTKKYVFISHPINNSGAPLVLLDIINETVAKYGAQNIVITATHIDATHLRRLRELGIRIEHASPDASLDQIKQQLNLNHDDFVLMNTIAVHDNYQRYVLKALQEKELDHASWFIHEDVSQVATSTSELLQEPVLDDVRAVIESGLLNVFVPSERVKEDYNELFKTDAVKVLPYKVDVPQKFKQPRNASDYSSLGFLLSGNPIDGRKGQFIALAAFYMFIKQYYEKNPDRYRTFVLNFVGLGEDYISQQLNDLAHNLLDASQISIYPSLSRDDALKVTSNCNTVICCSLNETFAIYVGEGMHMGHVVLRNNSAGMEEQLQEGVNGYYIDEKKVDQFAGVIERLLNKNTSTDTQLQKMGQASQQIIAPFSENTYLQKIEKDLAN